MSMFFNRVKKNYVHLRKWAKREGHTAFRVYDRDIPEFPFAVDYYDGALVVSYYAHAEETEEQQEELLALGKAELCTLFGTEGTEVFVKERRRKQGQTQYEKLAQSSVRRVVEEYGLKFVVNLSDYLDTGLFLDHRMTRKMLGSLSSQKRVLNLFCYTGSASVHAAASGAQSVTSVDLSNTYLAWAQENFEINNFSMKAHLFIRDDVQKFLQSAAKRNEKYDVIFVDPPSFSNSKKMEGFFDVQLHHVPLLQECLAVLAPGGIVVFSNNLRTFKIDKDAFPGLEISNITEKTLPPDFRNKRIHNVWLLK